MATAEYVTKFMQYARRNLANYSFVKRTMINWSRETEEYEPLSRAAYYHADEERSGGKINPLPSTVRDSTEGEGG
jgi:thymidine kinase